MVTHSIISHQINSSEFQPIKKDICHTFIHLGFQIKTNLKTFSAGYDSFCFCPLMALMSLTSLESEVFPCCLCCMKVGNELSKTVSALPSTISYFNLVASTVFQHSVACFWLLGCYHLLCSDINETDIFEKIFSGKMITKKILVERQSCQL